MSLDALYPKAILKLAASAAGSGRLPAPTHSVSRSNPICGDKITVDLIVEQGKVAAVGFEVKACVLCQASASILGAHLPGDDIAQVAILHTHVRAMLKTGGPAPEGRYAAYAALASAAPHASRHTCVLLPLEALDEVLT